MKRDLTQQSRSQNRTTESRTGRDSVPKRLSVVSTLAFLAFVILGMCGSQTAQAQVFKIEPLNPPGFANNSRSRAGEDTDPTFRITLTGGTGGTNYSVNLSASGVVNFNGDTPQEDVDFDSTNRNNNFPQFFTLQPGQTRDVTLDVFDDESFEQETFLRDSFNYDEMVEITISGAGGGATIAQGTVTYGIIDNDAFPVLRVRDTRVAIQDNTAEARFVEGSTGTTTGQNFTVELVGAAARQPGFRNNDNNLVLTTSIRSVTFDYDYRSGNGTDPTNSGQRAPGSATLGTDFIGNFGTANIAAGTNSAPIFFSVVGDTQDESNEAFIVRIINPRDTDNPTGTVALSNPEGDSGFGVILDDDAPIVTVSDASVTEGAEDQTTVIRFSVELSRASVQPVELVYFNQNGTAVDFVRAPNDDPDYNGVLNILTISPGSTLEFISITVNGDNVSEGGAARSENFSLGFRQNDGNVGLNAQFYTDVPNRRAIPGFPGRQLVPERAQRGATFANNKNTAVGTIIDDDVTNISIADAQVVEGDGTGQTTLNFRISVPFEERSENAVSVTATTSSGALDPPVANTDPATPGSDYVSQSTTVTIPATQTEAVFQVFVNNDDIDERNETLLVTLTNNTPGTLIADDKAVGTITDNDGPTISIANAQVAEGAPGATSTLNFPVTLSVDDPNNPNPQGVSISYRTTDGTAVSSGANPDFQPIPPQPVKTLVIPAGQTTGNISITVLGDNIREANETFTVVLSGAQNAAPIPFTVSQATGTIVNDDEVPMVRVTGTLDPPVLDPSAVEGNNVSFFISLVNTNGDPARSDQPITVNFSTDPASATSGADFGAITNGSVTFNPPTASSAGDPTTKTIFISTVDDTIDEVDEQFNFNLTSATGADIGRAQAIGTILDNDTQNISILDVTMAEGNGGGTTNFVFPITLGDNTTAVNNAQPIVLNYTTSNGSAIAPGDYATTTGQITIAAGTIPAGQPAATITVPVVADNIAESPENFTLTLSIPGAPNTPNPPRANLVKAVATGTITNDDTALISFASGNVSVIEGAPGDTNNLQFTVQLSNASDRTVTVNYATSQGATDPATPGTDFTTTSGTLTILAGATSGVINVPVIGDTLDEANETILLTLSAPTGGAAFPLMTTTLTATGTITDDDGAPSLSIEDVTVAEGGNANFTVTLAPASGQTVTVNYTTADISTTAGTDYIANSGLLTFGPGETTKNITVQVLGDADDEVNETFAVNLSNVQNAIIGDAQGIGTITDDDGPSITADDVAVSESAGSITIPVTLSASSPQAITVDFSTANISALAGVDYTATTGTLNFPANQTTATITIPILDNTFNEAVETFSVNLTNSTNATIADAQGIVTINDDDPLPTVSISNETVTEGDTGTVTATFTVNLNVQSQQSVTVDYLTASGSATINSDFVSKSGTLVFNPGDTSKPITVVVNGDIVSENDETFTVNLANPTNVTIANGVGTGTIIDDDVATLTLTIVPASLTEGDQALGTLTRNTQAQPSQAVALTSSNSALLGVPANVTIPANAASVTFPVQAVEDQIANDDATVSVTASATGFAPATANVAVTDNDNPRLTLTVAATELTEGGANTTATVSRNTSTSSALTVGITSNSSAVTVPESVTIPAGQQSVTFAVTPVDNAIADGTRTVILSATRAGFTPSTVSVSLTVADNDNATVVVTPTSLITSEAGASATFTVRLTSQPTANVVVNLVNGDTTEGTLSVNALTFTPQNFAQEQSVTVTGVDDRVQDGAITYQITTSITSDDVTYAAIKPADVQVTNTDNDVSGFIVAPRGVRTTEAGGSGTFSISLTSQPTANVVIGLSVDNPREATLSTSSLTFTPQNFATPQAVVVTGRDDQVRDGTVIYNIITAPADSADRAYDGLNPADVKAASTDNDASAIRVEPLTRAGLVVTEGQRSAFRIRLTSQPTAPVSITLSSSDPSEASLPQSVVVLNADNYREGVQVAVNGVQDNVADGPQRFLIRTDSAESTDRLYNLPGAAIADIGGTSIDVNRAALILAGPTSQTTSEDGTTIQFSVRLSSSPVSPVRVRVTSSDLSEGVVENSGNATFLTFTAENFGTAQTVTVTGRDDDLEDGPQRYNINLLAQTASGTFNNVTATVPLVNTDNDDLTKPVISISGIPGSVLRPGDLRAITGQATDANGVARINVVVQKTDGATPTFLNADGTFGATRVELPATFNATTGQFNLPIPGGTLPTGTYVVEATATDRAGNVSAPDRVNFTISSQLIAITIATPANGSVITGTTNVTGTVRSLSGGAISTVTVTVQGGTGSPRNIPVTLSGNNFSTASLGSLPTGSYKVTVTATDEAGTRQSATSTFSVDTVAPTAVTITNPTNNAVVDNITTISGTASDNAGGSGIARVEVVVLRNTDGLYFNGRTFVSGFATAPATVSGNNFVLNISGGLPADPDPLNATYTLQAIAFDRAANSVRSDSILVFLSSNGSAPGTTQASQVQLSAVKYSSGAAKADEVILNFTGALNASAAKAANYQVTVNGVATEVESAASRGSSAKVSLANALAIGDEVEVTYNLQDAKGLTLKGKVALSAR